MRIAVRDLLSQLIAISEKSAQISRLCRSTISKDLFELLIEEKTSEAKNPRFLNDFKTLTDVLIQEVAKFDLETKFPSLSKRVYGEETNQFANKLGESITVQIEPDVGRTMDMLIRILDGDEQTAKSLVQIIYSCPEELAAEREHLAPASLSVEQNDIAIWIDPIDSTSEYIRGQWNTFGPTDGAESGISPHGLHCVTCLFGLFDTKTGFPLIGVLNQPFYKQHSAAHGAYSGRVLWGYNINGVCQNNLNQLSDQGHTIANPQRPQLILVGGKESDEIKHKLGSISRTLYVAGAGYKILCVIVAQADLLVTSSKTTFFWDTCAGHAILRSLGGGIIALDDIMQLETDRQADLESLQIRYRPKDEHRACGYNHSKGLVAYRSKERIERAIQVLRS